MKDVRDYMEYLKNNPEERELVRSFSPEERAQHVGELGFEFTEQEFLNEMELAVELSQDDLDAVAGGKCCGKTCEEDWDAITG